MNGYEYNQDVVKKPEGNHIEIRVNVGGSDVLLVVGLDGWEYKGDIRGGKWSSSKGLNVRISMNGPLRLTLDEYHDFTQFVDQRVQYALADLKKIEVLNLDWEFDGHNYNLPEHLVIRQKLIQEEVDAVKHYQKSRAIIEKAMALLSPADHKFAIQSLYEEWQRNEDSLQIAWGFGLDRRKQRWFDVPHCSCPKMDNAERLGTDFSIYNENCILHA